MKIVYFILIIIGAFFATIGIIHIKENFQVRDAQYEETK